MYLESSHAQSFSQQRLLETIHFYTSLLYNKKMQLPYDQNVAISLRETVPGPLDHWIHTHGQNLPKQLLHRADSALPWTQSSWATATWQAVTLKMQQQKPAVHMCVYIYTHTCTLTDIHTHTYFCLYTIFFLYICIQTHTAVCSGIRCVTVLYPSLWLSGWFFSPRKPIFLITI